jgi:hypothetical protein
MDYDIQKAETLKIIRYLESSDGKLMNHKSSAKGEYGIMPFFLKDVKKAFGYSDVKLKDDHARASLCYDYIVKQIGTRKPANVAYAWYAGTFKLKPIPYRRPDITKHFYVKRFKAKAVASSLTVKTLIYFPFYKVKSRIALR